MQRYEIRDLHSNKKIKPRVLDLIMNDDGTNKRLEIKNVTTATISWDDVEYQVGIASDRIANK